jgi:hypothetical protein
MTSIRAMMVAEASMTVVSARFDERLPHVPERTALIGSVSVTVCTRPSGTVTCCWTCSKAGAWASTRYSPGGTWGNENRPSASDCKVRRKRQLARFL